MKPRVQHDHVVEVKIPDMLQEKVEQARDQIEQNKKPLAFGLGGLVAGVVLTRLFARPSINVEVNIVGKE